MSNQVKVYTPEEFWAAAQESEKNQTPLFTIQKKTGKAADTKFKGGSFFLNYKYHNLGGNPKAEGWFSIRDVPIQAIPDPSKKKAGQEDIKPQISMCLSALGVFGQALAVEQKQWVPAIESLIAQKVIPAGKKVHDLYQTHISLNAEERAGEPLDDPIFRVKIADRGETFPPTYPISILANKPKTEIYDYRTGRMDNGKAVYDLATIEDDNGRRVPVDYTNLHKFVTKGSVLRYGRLMTTSVAVSQNWISKQYMFTKIIVEPGAPTQFSDDADDLPIPVADSTTTYTHIASNVTHTASTASTDATPGAPNVAAPPAATDDEIAAALSGL